MKLVSLEAMKADLRVDHDSDDADIESKISAASAAVMNYLKVPHTYYTDSTGAIPVDADGEPDVPFEVRAATMLLVRDFFKAEKDRAEWQPGYLPASITSLLYPLRDPAMG